MINNLVQRFVKSNLDTKFEKMYRSIRKFAQDLNAVLEKYTYYIIKKQLQFEVKL